VRKQTEAEGDFEKTETDRETQKLRTLEEEGEEDFE
jgi:hypothetical protein